MVTPSIQIPNLLESILQASCDDAAKAWLQEAMANLKSGQHRSAFYLAFGRIPQKIGREPLPHDVEALNLLEKQVPGSVIRHWSRDRLARVWFLTALDSSNREAYIQQVEQLFRTAEMNELVALYSALPFLAWPEAWRQRCSEGIRSNMAPVLEAIMYSNPYPAKWLDEGAWNQMIMKAFFTDKEVNRITGLDERANEVLATILFDYAHERWQAGRSINPMLWRLTGAFLNERHMQDLQRLVQEGSVAEKKAAILACADSSYPPAQELCAMLPELKILVEKKQLTWQSLAADLSSTN